MEIFTEYRAEIFEAFWTTVQLTAYSAVGALILGTVLGGMRLSPVPMLAWLGELAADNGLVLPNVPPPTSGRRVFERSLVAALGDTKAATSVGWNLAALRNAASAVRIPASGPVMPIRPPTAASASSAACRSSFMRPSRKRSGSIRPIAT